MENEETLSEMTGIPQKDLEDFLKNKKQGSSFQRNEAFGDPILGYLVADRFAQGRYHLNECQLGIYRSLVTRNYALSMVFQQLGPHLFPPYKRMQSTGEYNKDEADVIEALLGFIHQRLGLEKVKAFVYKYIFPVMERILRTDVVGLPNFPLLAETLPEVELIDNLRHFPKKTGSNEVYPQISHLALANKG